MLLPHFDVFCDILLERCTATWNLFFYGASLLVAISSKELRLVQEDHATVKLDSSVASRGIKTYSEGRIELQNLQFLKKMLEKSGEVL